MKIDDILMVMASLSLEDGNMGKQEKEIFLRYLNLAHFDLYQETANVNQDIFLNENIDTDAESQAATLSKQPFCVQQVFDVTNGNILKEMALSDILESDPSFTRTERPEFFFRQKNQIKPFPIQKHIVTLNVWYTPQPSNLALTTPEEDIPYPLAYHHLLADGALYYLFQDEAGFKNPQKSQEALRRWEVGKSRIFSYLFNTFGVKTSTFSSV